MLRRNGRSTSCHADAHDAMPLMAAVQDCGMSTAGTFGELAAPACGHSTYEQPAFITSERAANDVLRAATLHAWETPGVVSTSAGDGAEIVSNRVTPRTVEITRLQGCLRV